MKRSSKGHPKAAPKKEDEDEEMIEVEPKEETGDGGEGEGGESPKKAKAAPADGEGGVLATMTAAALRRAPGDRLLAQINSSVSCSPSARCQMPNRREEKRKTKNAWWD